ncbi:MAG: CNNM domain-containing protein [Bacilli bacterium]
MPDEPHLLWIAFIILIIIGMFFSASETAYTTANKIRLKVKAENGSRSAKLALWIIKHIDGTIITVLIWANLVQIILSSIATMFFVNLIGSGGGVVATLVITLVIFLIVDTIPKSITNTNPERVAMINSYLVAFFLVILYPLTILFRLFIKLLKKIFKFTEDTTLTEEDFSNVIEESEEKGVLDETVSDIILSTLVFEDRIVSEVTTKKEDIFALDIKDLTNDKLNDCILTTPFSRIPIYRNTKDNIIGVIVVREYIKAYLDDNNVKISKIMHRPYYVSKDIKFDDIIEGFQKHKTHIAFVYDENNSLIGMVTMEDVLQQLVGKIEEPINKMSKVKRKRANE